MPEIARCVIAGGNGQVGRMFALKLARSGVEVIVVDPVAPVGETLAYIRYERGDIMAPDERITREVARADLVLLAVPENVALAAIPPLAAIMKRSALLADTLSVKSQLAVLVRDEVRHLEVVSLNPMFAPSLEMAGRPVAVVTLVGGPLSQSLQELLISWGAQVVPIEAADHDRFTSALQVATHSAVLAFGLALRALDVEIGDLYELAPPPHLMLLALLARIASGVPEVYWDIQAGNPQAPAARAALQRGIEHISKLADSEDEAGFQALLTEMQALLGHRRATLVDLCAQVFDGLTPRASTDDDRVD